MNWITLLEAQQADFIKRLEYGCLLHCEKMGQHSELTIISGEKLLELRAFCWQMAEKYKRMSYLTFTPYSDFTLSKVRECDRPSV